MFEEAKIWMTIITGGIIETSLIDYENGQDCIQHVQAWMPSEWEYLKWRRHNFSNNSYLFFNFLDGI